MTFLSLYLEPYLLDQLKCQKKRRKHIFLQLYTLLTHLNLYILKGISQRGIHKSFFALRSANKEYYSPFLAPVAAM